MTLSGRRRKLSGEKIINQNELIIQPANVGARTISNSWVFNVPMEIILWKSGFYTSSHIPFALVESPQEI